MPLERIPPSLGELPRPQSDTFCTVGVSSPPNTGFSLSASSPPIRAFTTARRDGRLYTFGNRPQLQALSTITTMCGLTFSGSPAPAPPVPGLDARPGALTAD